MGGSETKTNSISQWKTIKKDRKLPYSIVRDDNGREGE